MKLTSLVLGSLLLSASVASGHNYTNIPPEAPLFLPVPEHAQAPRDTLRLVFEVCARQFYSCIVLYVYPLCRVDPWDAHVWVLQRSSPNYNNGQWENLAQKVCALTTTNAIAMFSDRIDRDNGTGAMVSRYRVVDMGSYTP